MTAPTAPGATPQAATDATQATLASNRSPETILRKELDFMTPEFEAMVHELLPELKDRKPPGAFKRFINWITPKSAIANLFLLLINFRATHKIELVDSKDALEAPSDQPGATKKVLRENFYNAIFSKNVLIALLSLGVGYAFFHVLEFIGVLGEFVAYHLGAYLGVVGFSLWHVNAVIKKNLAYEETKMLRENKLREIISEIDALKKLSAPFTKQSQRVKYLQALKISSQFTTSDALIANKQLLHSYHDEKHFLTNNLTALETYHYHNGWIEALKKVSRVLMISAIVIGIEIITGVHPGVIAGTLAAALGIGYLDLQAQRKEAAHEAKLAKLHATIVYLHKYHVQLLHAQKQHALHAHKSPQSDKSNVRSNLNNLKITSNKDFEEVKRAHLEKPSDDWADHAIHWENALALTGLSAGYVAFGLFSSYGLNEFILEQGQGIPGGELAIEALLYTPLTLLAIALIAVNIYANSHRLMHHAHERFRLTHNIARLQEDIDTIIDNFVFKKDLTALFPTEKNGHWQKDLATEYKHTIIKSEAVKKGLRICMYYLMFAGAQTMLGITTLGTGILVELAIVALVAVAASVADYKVRRLKEREDNELGELREQEMRLTAAKGALLNSIDEQAVGKGGLHYDWGLRNKALEADDVVAAALQTSAQSAMPSGPTST